MTTVSVDLAYRSYSDIGVSVLDFSASSASVIFHEFSGVGDPRADHVASFIAGLCDEVGARTLLLDGPQAWKDSANGLEHSRLCERELNAPAKTGLPGMVKPRNYASFVSFSIEVFDELALRGWSRYTRTRSESAKIVAESLPLSAWRSLGMPILPAKRKCSNLTLEERAVDLAKSFKLKLPRMPNHDELQSMVAGLAGRGLERRGVSGIRVSGVAPFLHEGSYREGFIVNPAHAC
jgi:hypothetical protein